MYSLKSAQPDRQAGYNPAAYAGFDKKKPPAVKSVPHIKAENSNLSSIVPINNRTVLSLTDIESTIPQNANSNNKLKNDILLQLKDLHQSEQKGTYLSIYYYLINNDEFDKTLNQIDTTVSNIEKHLLATSKYSSDIVEKIVKIFASFSEMNSNKEFLSYIGNLDPQKYKLIMLVDNVIKVKLIEVIITLYTKNPCKNSLEKDHVINTAIPELEKYIADNPSVASEVINELFINKDLLELVYRAIQLSHDLKQYLSEQNSIQELLDEHPNTKEFINNILAKYTKHHTEVVNDSDIVKKIHENNKHKMLFLSTMQRLVTIVSILLAILSMVVMFILPFVNLFSISLLLIVLAASALSIVTRLCISLAIVNTLKPLKPTVEIIKEIKQASYYLDKVYYDKLNINLLSNELFNYDFSTIIKNSKSFNDNAIIFLSNKDLNKDIFKNNNKYIQSLLGIISLMFIEDNKKTKSIASNIQNASHKILEFIKNPKGKEFIKNIVSTIDSDIDAEIFIVAMIEYLAEVS